MWQFFMDDTNQRASHQDAQKYDQTAANSQIVSTCWFSPLRSSPTIYSHPQYSPNYQR